MGKYDELGDDAHSLKLNFSFHKRSADLAGFIIYNEKEEEMFSLENTRVKSTGCILIKILVTLDGYKMQTFHYTPKKILTAIKLKK